jgi:hypothetical protein
LRHRGTRNFNMLMRHYGTRDFNMLTISPPESAQQQLGWR